MIIAIRGFQDTGKTSLALVLIKEFLRIGALFIDGFREKDVVGNLIFKKMLEAHSINNAQMRTYIRQMVEKGLTHKIVLIDEADRIFPARFWQMNQQTETLIGLWQDYKLFNIVLYTAHEGTGVDIMLRDVTQIEIHPDYVARDDAIYFRVYNGVKGLKYNNAVHNASRIFQEYDRWERIV